MVLVGKCNFSLSANSVGFIDQAIVFWSLSSRCSHERMGFCGASTGFPDRSIVRTVASTKKNEKTEIKPTSRLEEIFFLFQSGALDRGAERKQFRVNQDGARIHTKKTPCPTVHSC
jgi:ABC-type antimicrobial peptide transport system ATPase subunit